MGLLNAENSRPAEIQGQIVEVYCEGAVCRGNVRKWCRLFRESRTNAHEEGRSGRTHSTSRKFLTVVTTDPTLHQHTVTFFLHLKEFLADQSLTSGQKTKDIVQDWLRGFKASFCDEGLKKLVQRCDKCLNLHDASVQKYSDLGIVQCSTVQYSTVQCSTVQKSTRQYSTVQ